MIYNSIKALVDYAVSCGLITPQDEVYCTNRVLELLELDEYEAPVIEQGSKGLEEILRSILDYACAKGIIQDDTTSRDLFDTRLMSIFVPMPSQVISSFYSLYDKSAQLATDYYYKLSCDSDYIRRYRVERDLKWKVETEYGALDITVNLSKPEKSPKEIAAARAAAQSGYPKCLLCPENEGYAGRTNHPARQNHRIIPITVGGQQWGFQYSPYVYYNEHCIVFNKSHTPMKIDKSAFVKLFDFVKLFGHYFIGSNADLPIVGGSILSHEHFQGGRYTFAMQTAESEKFYSIKGFEDVTVARVKWPMSVLRLTCADSDRIVELADRILCHWRQYSDESLFIYASTDGQMHNTVTPIARRRGELFELDLVLRNNITTPEHPLGVFHPHEELHHIKKENIGLIEVMGLAVLPSRLKDELALLKRALIENTDIKAEPSIAKHADWADSLREKYEFTEENTEQILRLEVGRVFEKVLCHAGVFKRDESGMRGMDRFVESLSRS